MTSESHFFDTCSANASGGAFQENTIDSKESSEVFIEKLPIEDDAAGAPTVTGNNDKDYMEANKDFEVIRQMVEAASTSGMLGNYY